LYATSCLQLNFVYLRVLLYVPPVTPPPTQPEILPVPTVVVFTVAELDSGGNAGVNTEVPVFVLHVVPPAAPAGDASNPTGSTMDSRTGATN
jgi:hypothetical protein